MKTILICFSNTGGGHRSATAAIKDALEELGSDLLQNQQLEIVANELVERSSAVHSVFVSIYNYLLGHHQNWLKYYYSFIEWLKPNEWAPGYWLGKKYLIDLLKRTQPTVVVSVHPMTNHYIARAIDELGWRGKTKLVVVVTDPNDQFWTGWACKGADLTIVPNDLAQARLVKLGIDGSRIRILGMPVGTEFSRPAHIDRSKYLKALGLDPARLTICLTAGQNGGGNMLRIYRALRTKQNKAIQAIVLCGHNEKLMANIQSEKNVPTAVVSHVESLSDLMSVCDLLITKAGGLTTFEAIARHLPMALDMLTEPMPQEVGTTTMLIEAGLAKPLKHPEDIVPILESLENSINRERQQLPSQHSLNCVNASTDIAKILLELCTDQLSSARQ